MKPYSEIENINDCAKTAKKLLLNFEDEDASDACSGLTCVDCHFDDFLYDKNSTFCNAVLQEDFHDDKKLKQYLQGLVDFVEKKDKPKVRLFGTFNVYGDIEVQAEDEIEAKEKLTQLFESNLPWIKLSGIGFTEVNTVTIDPAKEKAQNILDGLSEDELEALKGLIEENEKHKCCGGCTKSE